MLLCDTDTMTHQSQGHLEWEADEGWNVPRYESPYSKRHLALRSVFINPGLVCNFNGQNMIYLAEENHWDNLASYSAMVSINLAMDMDNVTVNYDKSFAPYVRFLEKRCRVRTARYPPLSVCIATQRLTVNMTEDGEGIQLDTCPPLLEPLTKDMHPSILAVAYQPITIDKYPKLYRYPGLSTVIDYISGLYPNVIDMYTMMWIIGNSLVDPIVRPRTVMLAGPGGSGKSTVLRAIHSTMAGCCTMIPDGSLTSNDEGMSESIAASVVSSRMVICYDVDLERRNMNIGVFKNISGGDYVHVGMINAKSACSLALATNGLPNISDEPLYTSDAVVRRLVIVPMIVDVLGSGSADQEATAAEEYAEPRSIVDYMDFACACIYTRLKFSHMPIAPMTLLLTITCSKFAEAETKITEAVDRPPTRVEATSVIHIISELISCTPRQVITKCTLVSKFSVGYDNGFAFIKGLRTKYE